jgi:hypothetical protein
MTLARHPNKMQGTGTWQYMRQGEVLSARSFAAGTDDTMDGQPVPADPPWANISGEGEGLWAQGFFSWDWADSFVSVSQVHTAQQGQQPVIDIDAAPPYPLHKGSRYLLLNSKALLDAAGEYWIDAESDELFFIPP